MTDHSLFSLGHFPQRSDHADGRSHTLGRDTQPQFRLLQVAGQAGFSLLQVVVHSQFFVSQGRQ